MKNWGAVGTGQTRDGHAPGFTQSRPGAAIGSWAARFPVPTSRAAVGDCQGLKDPRTLGARSRGPTRSALHRWL